MQELIMQCLEVAPEKRPATAGQLAFDLMHPDQVALTVRAERMKRDGFLTVARRRFSAFAAARRPAPPRLSQHLAAAPIVMAAIDLAPEMEPLADALRTIVSRIVAIEPEARLACVNVLKTPRLGVDFGEDEQGRNLHVQRLVELKHWTQSLKLSPNASPTPYLNPPTHHRHFSTTRGTRMSIISSSVRAVRRLCAVISAAFHHRWWRKRRVT
jgi:hypothetical protein